MAITLIQIVALGSSKDLVDTIITRKESLTMKFLMDMELEDLIGPTMVLVSILDKCKIHTSQEAVQWEDIITQTT
jgi:hypothetical protein